MSPSPETQLDRGYSPGFVRFFSRILRPVCAVWFRLRFDGAERVPAAQCLFVGNHGGIGIADIVCLYALATGSRSRRSASSCRTRSPSR